MLDFSSLPNYSGPSTTANSEKEGRLKVDVNQKKKKKIIKKILRK
jgi:hypothetical protein